MWILLLLLALVAPATAQEVERTPGPEVRAVTVPLSRDSSSTIHATLSRRDQRDTVLWVAANNTRSSDTSVVIDVQGFTTATLNGRIWSTDTVRFYFFGGVVTAGAGWARTALFDSAIVRGGAFSLTVPLDSGYTHVWTRLRADTVGTDDAFRDTVTGTWNLTRY